MEMKELVALARRLNDNNNEVPKYLKINPEYYALLITNEQIKKSPIATPESLFFGLKFEFDETVETYKFIYN